MEHWLDGKVFDRMEILREEPTRRQQALRIEKERIARHQTRYRRPPLYNRAATQTVTDGTRLSAVKIPMSAKKARRLGIPEIYSDRSAFDGLVFYWQLLRQGKVVHSGRASNPVAQLMNFWQNRGTFDRMQILRIETTQRGQTRGIEKEELQTWRPLLSLRDGPAQHYLVGLKTACGRKKRGVATTKQRGQVSCLRCRDTKRFQEDEPKQRYRVNQNKTTSGLRKQHYLRNQTMTACSLRKKNGAVETTRQRSQVTCLRCRDTKRFRDEY